jgi:hypothetical protein
MIYKLGDIFNEKILTYPTEYSNVMEDNNYMLKGEVILVEDNNGWQFLHILFNNEKDGTCGYIPVGNYDNENDWCIYFC